MSRKIEIVNKLADIEEKIDSNSALDSEKEDRVKLLKERDDLQHLEDMDLKQKAKVTWDVEGDENTKLFHVKTAFCNFYKEKFDKCDSLSDFSTVTPQHTLDHNDNLELEKNVSDDEIRLTIWDCGSQKASGPDGFSFLFLKTYWDLLKDDVVRVMRGVFDSFKMPNGTNSSFITLIPNVANPIHVKDFWPISLIGMQYKIIVEVLANRLLKVIDKVVSKEQSAFISGRFILEGTLMISEIMSWYKKKKRNLMLFKVDFEKAFDTVSWKFLDHMLSSLGFGNKWRSWINICLHSARASVLVNGSPTSEFSIKRDWNRQDMINIIYVLNVFYLASGLKINVSKSNIYGLGMNHQDIEDMARDTRCGSDRFRARLSSWKANMLSIGGRLTLIKFVLGSLGIYYLSIFKFPELVLNSLEAMRGSFFLGAIQGAEAGTDLKGCYCNGVLASIILTYFMLHNRNLIQMNTLCHKVDNGVNDSWIWNWKRKIEGSRNEAALGSLMSDLGQVQLLDGPDSLPMQLNLSLRGLDISSIVCSMCNDVVEAVDHVFFGCDLACDVWHLVRRWTNLDMPSFSSWFDCFQWFEYWRASRYVKDKAYVIFVTLLWCLWRYRNGVTFSFNR
nr:hypothetical protein [Tanacetum cinerariifolium]